MSIAPTNGLLVLHGNRLEGLSEAVLTWLARHPLQPLEEEVFLVQSNGMAEWLKMEAAAALGVCSATRVELPARFIWRAYRAVLGRGSVPLQSPLDKQPLVWRLMKLLPTLATQPGFEPVAAFLAAGAERDEPRRLQLAERLADLLDQYQVYRADWLQDWAEGRDLLGADPVPSGQGWQPALWRALRAELPPADLQSTRPQLHQRFVKALSRKTDEHTGRAFPGLPRRVVLFGTTHIPHQTLQALAALADHCQVLMAVPNPCRYHWADLIEGRELLLATRRRHALRPGPDPAALPLQDLHLHGHPLLAAWGRQGRDFVRQLDAFDDVQAARERFRPPRVDLFDDGPGQTLLQRTQAAIRELLPLHEHAGWPDAEDSDRSIVFHVAHSAQREVEVLHDQLLHLFSHPPEGAPLAPRDVVVMVPDIAAFAPAIRAVFGQHARGSARHIPWGLADQGERTQQPLLVALDGLLRAPQQRFTASELRDLLDLPSLARRHRIAPEDLPLLAAWVEGAGVRWGLHEAHRASLGLQAAGAQNTWAFGLRRMLLGYATGALDGPDDTADGFQGSEPYAEVAGLAAGLAGALAELLQTLADWWQDARAPRTPAQWAERLRALVASCFEAVDDADRAVLAAADDALTAWLQACESAGFEAEVDLDVAREAWLGGVDEPGGAKRFRAGGVTFCTLLPLRAIPFQVVCLLGMNDGDYPRRSTRSDFDLMALPGQARPGDRSRRSDDRQLMLDALLSARRVLYLSWAGRSPRDNQAQPPSVLVAQLRDYLAAVWGEAAVKARTTEHPLQPFSRRYFEPEGAGRLFTYASEWRDAHVEVAAPPTPAPAPAADAPGVTRVTLRELADFIQNPVKAFFRRRLQVSFLQQEGGTADDESFGSSGLDRWGLLDDVLQQVRPLLDADAAASVPAAVQRQLARLQRAGRLPLAGPGERLTLELSGTLQPMLAHWQALCSELPAAHDKLPLVWSHPADPKLQLDDWLVGLRTAVPGGEPVWVELQASRLTGKTPKKGPPSPREDKLVLAWLRGLASAACGQPVRGVLIGVGAVVNVSPPPQAEAAAVLAGLLQACRDGLAGDAPLPTALRTGLAWLKHPDKPERARAVYEPSAFSRMPAEGEEPCLARLFPDFAALSQAPGFDEATRQLYEPFGTWLQTQVEVKQFEPETDEEDDGEADGEGADHG